MEGKRSSPGVKGKKLVPTDLKTKLMCFSPAYVLFSDLLPVSSLCFSRELAILICGLSHMAKEMERAGSRAGGWGDGVTLDEMGAECHDGVLPVPAWFCCVCRQKINSVSICAVESVPSCVSWSVPHQAKAPPSEVFWFWMTPATKCLISLPLRGIRKGNTHLFSLICLFIYFRKRNTGSTNTKASKRIKSQRKVVVPRVRTAVTARAMKKGPQTCHPRSCWDGGR